MGKLDLYNGSYILIDEVTKEESERLASSLCTIGMPVKLEFSTEDAKGFKVTDSEGRSLGTIHPSNRLFIREALEEGWGCDCVLSLVYYETTDGANLFKGEICCQVYNTHNKPEADIANLRAYTTATASRIAAGQRPDIKLTGTTYQTVIETGDWAPETNVALPIDTKRNSGAVIFKRKRSLADRLTQDLMEHKPGCKWGLYGACIIVLILVVILCLNIFRCSTGA